MVLRLLAVIALCATCQSCAGHKPYAVFQFDNGDDYFKEGLRRIVDADGKIGFEDESGLVVVAPQFQCAHPFEGGLAKVADNCASINLGEHSAWVSKNWYYIDKNGMRAWRGF